MNTVVQKKRLPYIIVVVVAVCIGATVYLLSVNKSHEVALEKSARALKLGELPSENKPDREAIANHAPVDDAYPKTLFISRLGLAARIIDVGISNNHDLESPANIFDVGWLRTSSKVNDPEGFMLLVGYKKGKLFDGAFSKLADLNKGDGILIETTDNKKTSFVVTSVKEIPTSEPLSNTVLASPTDKAIFELRMLVTSGPFEKPASRQLVFARRQ